MEIELQYDRTLSLHSLPYNLDEKMGAMFPQSPVSGTLKYIFIINYHHCHHHLNHLDHGHNYLNHDVDHDGDNHFHDNKHYDYYRYYHYV